LDRQGGEAQKISDVKGGMADFVWSPDGKRVLLVVSDFDNNDEPEQLDGWKRKTKPPVVIDRYHFKQDKEGYLGALQTHLQILDVATGKATVLTSGKYSESSPAWSPDGKQLAFFSNRAGKPDATEESSLFVIEAKEGATPRPLATTVTEEGAAPSWSPDGKWIAYLSGDALKYSAYHRFKLSVVPADGGASRVLTSKLDRRVEAPLNWSADSSQLYFLVEDDRASYAARLTLKGEQMERLSSGRNLLHSLVVGKDGKLATLAADAKHPFEVQVIENGSLRAVSHQNDDWLAQVNLGATEDFTSTSNDGTKVNGLISKPPGFVPGHRYPTLLYIHGGPNGQDGYRYDPMREAFTANGYVVLQVNYRGSSGRGDTFQKAIFADWGNKEVKDLLGAVDWAVAQGIADPARLGLGGWSYGGLLTDYTIASDTRFKAAVSGAGSGNQISMYGSDQYIVQYEQEVGAPWKKTDLWIKLSYPFFKADRIKTPTLFLSGEKDFNVPTAGAEQMYQALQSLGVPTQLVVYPGQFHGIAMPSYRRDVAVRYLGWFDKYLKAAPQ
jgi:dipeptidyl aminopeptidase/acylaminoacyl peptidase